MATNRAEAEQGSDPSSNNGQKNRSTSLDRRLEPLEEFRSRAEGWMKEVTAQVARLASSFEQEEHKRVKLEDRLSDIEERIRSLLTLTEMISQDKNPFAAQPDAPRAQQAHTTPPQAPPEAVDPFALPQSGPTDPAAGPANPENGPAPETEAEPSVETVPDSEPPASAPEAPEPPEQDPPASEPPLPAADRPGVEVIPVGLRSPAQTPAAEATNEPEFSQQPAPPQTQDEPAADGQNDAPAEESDPEPTPWSVPAPETDPPPETEDNTTGYHPNDAQAEPRMDPLEQNPAPPAQNAHTAHDETTARRLLVVAWADLLAPSCETIDVEAFTGFYVEAQWVDAETARLVQRLVETMAPHEGHRAPTDKRTLHEETVRLLARHDPSLNAFTRVDPPKENGSHEEGTGTDATFETDGPLNAT